MEGKEKLEEIKKEGRKAYIREGKQKNQKKLKKRTLYLPPPKSPNGKKSSEKY